MSRPLCEEYPSVKVTSLNKLGFFEAGAHVTEITWVGTCTTVCIGIEKHKRFLVADYKSVETGDNCRYDIELATTACHFGGTRYWMLCPLVKQGTPCRKRVGVLYLGTKYFGCRKCYGMAYYSQQQPHDGMSSVICKMDRYEKSMERIRQLRVRFHKGRYTKRYERLLRKVNRSMTTRDLERFLATYKDLQ